MVKKAGFVLVGLLLLVAVYLLGITRGYYGQVSLQNYSSVFKQEFQNRQLGSTDLGLLWTVSELMDEKYIGDVNYQNILYGTIKGAVAALGDPYSAFTDPVENREFFNALDGLYQGVGIELDILDGSLVIVAPLKDSPADKAGILPGDEILAVDDESVVGLNIIEVISRIKGPAGTKVMLTVGRKNEQALIDVEITRSFIRHASVDSEIDGNIAIINILRFATDTERAFRTAVNSIIASGAEGLILDLRSNPGGFLDVGVKVANEFLSSGMIVEERFKGGETSPFYSDGSGRLTDIPMVVLVDYGSASAAEIVAGALQDNKRATIIGETTFGKGSVQEVDTFPDGSALRLTIAKWYTPAGISIDDEGIVPDRIVSWDPETEDDEQLDAAKEFLQELIEK